MADCMKSVSAEIISPKLSYIWHLWVKFYLINRLKVLGPRSVQARRNQPAGNQVEIKHGTKARKMQ